MKKQKKITRRHNPEAHTIDMAITKALGFMILMLVAVAGEARQLSSGNMADTMMMCHHRCKDKMSECIGQECIPIPLGVEHNHCHVNCQQKCMHCIAVCKGDDPSS